MRQVRRGAFVVGALLWLWPAGARAAGVLTVEVVNGYNLVVDSNVTAPSTYAPRSAYIGARVCNTGDTPLANVLAYAGDYQGGVGDTPGVFPAWDSTGDPRAFVAGTGLYSLTLEAGETGSGDGTRYIGTLAAGACRMQYWLISYPQCVNVGGQPDSPPCAVSITGGIKPADDVSLNYDVWATTTTGIAQPTVSATRTLTLRNEISAAANKIWPNTTSKVPDEYLAAIQSVVGWGTLGPDGQPLTAGNPVYPGQRVITTQGIWYDLGNVGAGFDNNGDLVPDQNAWLQPVGDPGSFDADCFRLVNVYGIVIVKLKSGGELLIPFQNRLYFESLPDNTGVVGLVYYQFIATDDGCSANMTPYQEAASGFDNEKFSADYGLALGLASGGYGAALSFAKSDGVASVAPGGTLTYTLSTANTGTGANLGAPDLGTPLAFRETIPAGTTYVSGSAAAGLTVPSGTGSYAQGFTDADGNLDSCTINYSFASAASYVILHSTDDGATWSLAEPVPASAVTDLRWLLFATLALDGAHNGTACVAPDGIYDDGTLETSLPAGKSAAVTFSVTVNSAAPHPGPVVCNTGGLGYGAAESGVTAQDCDIVTGGNTLSGLVFRDDGGTGGIFGNGAQDNATETGIGAGVIVELYYDANGDGRRGAGDLLYGSTATAANGTYSFGSLADGPYVVAVRKYGLAGAGNDVNDFVAGWGDTTLDPNLPLTTDLGVLKLNEDLNAATLAVNIDYNRDSGAQAVSNANFAFAPPLRLTKSVRGNPDANADGRADTAVDEGDALSYTIGLENRLPSVGRQGATGCEYTVWAVAGATGSNPKDFASPGNAYDATSPNGMVATALVEGGGLRWLYGRSFALAPQPGSITKVEALYFGYFSTALTDDFLNLEDSFSADASGLTAPKKAATLSTSVIDSYIGARPDFGPDSAISWDISALRPGCVACSVSNWSWADFPNLYLFVNAAKASAADAKTFSLDAIGVRVTSDRDCEAGSSTTLSPVPLQDSYDTGSFAFVSADPPPDSVNTATGVIQWNDVGPILPGTTRTVTVTLRPVDVDGTRTGSCGASPPPAANSACNWAETAWGGRNVTYADGRPANDASGKIAVAIQGKAELRGVAWADSNADGWPDNDGEPRLPNVPVTLWGCTTSAGAMVTNTGNNKYCSTYGSWTVLATTLTGANGAYEFIGLDQGYYIVEVGNSDGAPVTGNSSPFGGTQTAEPNDTQAYSGGSATGTSGVCAGAGGCNNTWGNPDAELLAGQTTINLLGDATAGSEETVGGVNFGYSIPNAVVYGNVWHDIDGDAAAEPGEGGLSGFAVQLYTDADGDGVIEAGDTVVAATTSDANGNFSFSGLAADDYVVKATPPTLPSKAWIETVETTGGTGSLDNQIPVTVAAGAFSGSHNLGYTLADTSNIGDTLYYDFDADGWQDPAEFGIPDVTVWLYSDVDRDGSVDDGIDELIATDVTDASGKYLFEDRPAGSYIVRVDTDDPDLPPGVTPTGDPDTNSASIGDRVWLDADGDGVQDAGEEGLPGVVVNLYHDADGSGSYGGGEPLVASTVTGANGSYLFTGLNAGGYFVDVDETTLPNSLLSLTTADPLATLVTLAGRTSAYQVLTADAGYSLSSNYALGSRVWSDADGDNVQDAGEAGVPGITVTVTGTGCAPCTAVTDANGSWLVTGAAGLANGNYTVDLRDTDLPRNFTLTAGADPRTVTISNADLMTADFGYRYNTDANVATEDAGDPTGTITGRVYRDVNGNETYDAGVDAALSGAFVNLLDDEGEVVASATTAADGTYSVTGVFIGAYSVQTVDRLATRYGVLFLSAGRVFSGLDSVYSDAKETTADGESSVSVDGVHDDLNQDFGYQRFAGSIGDTVYQDVNENATQDPGEPGLSGVTVRLFLCGWADDGDGLFESGEETGCPTALATTTTGADNALTDADEGGQYLFSNLDTPAAGQYYVVRVDTTTLPGTPTLVADPGTDGYPCTLLPSPDVAGDEYPPPSVCDSRQLVPGFAAGVNYLGADFGYRIAGAGYATIGDRLWIDADGDGLADAGEPGVGFVTVWLDTDDDGILDWTDGNGNGGWDAGEGERWVETDPDGFYVFAGVADGTYNAKVLTSDTDWPSGLPVTPVYEARSTNTASLNNAVQVVVAGGTVTSIVDGDAGTPDACTKIAPETCNLDADFGYRYAGANTLRGTICTESGTLNGYCGNTAATYSGAGNGESPLTGIQLTLYRWNDADADSVAWAADGTLDAGDTFTLLGSVPTDAAGDYSFSNVPTGKLVLVLGVSGTQNLRLTTTSATSSLEGAASVQLHEGTSLYQGNTVTVLARQALNAGGNVLDVDFAFDASLGGAIAYDFGDLPDTFVAGPPDTPDYDSTLLASGGARHLTGSISLGAGVTSEADGRDAPLADQDADDGVVIPGDWVPGAAGGWVRATASAAGWLAGWIDFNGDGDFDDAGEFVVSQAVSAGAQDIGFDLPAGIDGSNLIFFSRFRVYPSRPLLVASTGLALDAAFQPARGEVEDYRWNVNVTAAVVSAFSACDAGGAVGLEWRTSSEVGTVGFFLRRRDSALQEYRAVNERLLPALIGTARGGTYRYVDDGAAPYREQEYELVEVEGSGRRTTHGPFAVNAAAAGACGFPAGAVYSSAPAAPLAAPAPGGGDPGAQAAAGGPLESAKVFTAEGGIHYLAAGDLARALGVDPAEARRLLRENALSLGNRGRSVALLPARDFGGAFFLAEPEESSFSRDNVYLAGVHPEGGVLMASRVEDATGRPTGEETFTRTVRGEEDRFPAHAIFTDARQDHWFWDYLVAGEAAKSHPVRADGVAAGAGQATLTLLLVGATDTAADPDHHAEVRVNGTVVGDVRWNGLATVEANLDFDAGLLENGANTVEVAALDDTPAPYGVFYLDSFALRYRSRYRPVDDRLSCDAAGNPVVRLSGFSSPEILVFDVTHPTRPVFVRARSFATGEGEYGVDLAPTDPGARYEALTRGAVVRARRVAGDRPSSLRSERAGAASVVVTTGALREPAARLAAHRGGVVVDIEDVYDEFNHGIPSPYALKRFLRQAWMHWQTRPRYVVLAGDGSHDYRDNLGLGGNLIPPMLVGTGNGLFPSDTWFADIGGGAAPEIAIGRLPAANAAELGRLVDKILLRESAGGAAWQGRVLALADDADAAGDFPARSERLAALAPPGTAATIHLGEMSIDRARAALFAGLRAGAGLVSYVGHAGYDVLAAEGLLTGADVAQLDNSRTPTVLVASTCLVGDFALPGHPGLGELLVRKPFGGAAAVWAPSGLARDELSSLLAEHFHAAYHSGENLRLGDAVLRAMRAYERTGNAPSTLGISVLLGDPGMRLR